MSDTKQLFNDLLGRKVTSTDADKVFQHFDSNKDGALDRKELKHLLKCLATSGTATEQHLNKIHDFLDNDKDGVVSRNDFLLRGAEWLRVIFGADSALVIVDVQNDFISGSLALKKEKAGQDGEEVVPVINRALESCGHLFKVVVYSFDWHPANHISFVTNVGRRPLAQQSPVQDASRARTGDTVVLQTESYGPVEQRLWPAHCVQHSWGAELHPRLMVVPQQVKIFKGTDPDIDSYSAFWDNDKRKKTELCEQLARRGISDVVVCGLATDVCVGATAQHSQELGFRTALLEDASRGISCDGIARTKAKLAAGNGVVAVTDQLADLLEKRQRPMEWVLAAASSAQKSALGNS